MPLSTCENNCSLKTEAGVGAAAARAWAGLENTVLATGYTVNPEDLHLSYEIRGKDTLRWKPVRVWDDGVKTYIQFKPGSVKKSKPSSG